MAYLGSDSGLKHYLIEPNDLGAKKLLGDFLQEKEQFRFLLQCVGYSEGQPQFRVAPKEEVLRGHVSSAPQGPRAHKDGYDPLDNPWASLAPATPPAKRFRTQTGAVKRALE